MSRQGWTSSVCVLSRLEPAQLWPERSTAVSMGLCLLLPFLLEFSQVFLEHFQAQQSVNPNFLSVLLWAQARWNLMWLQVSWCVSSTHILQVTSGITTHTHRGVISEQNLNLHCTKSLRSVWAWLVSFPQTCSLTLAEYFVWQSSSGYVNQDKFWKQGFRIDT